MLSHAFVSVRMIKSPPYTARGKCHTAAYRTPRRGLQSLVWVHCLWRVGPYGAAVGWGLPPRVRRGAGL